MIKMNDEEGEIYLEVFGGKLFVINPKNYFSDDSVDTNHSDDFDFLFYNLDEKVVDDFYEKFQKINLTVEKQLKKKGIDKFFEEYFNKMETDEEWLMQINVDLRRSTRASFQNTVFSTAVHKEDDEKNKLPIYGIYIGTSNFSHEEINKIVSTRPNVFEMPPIE